MPPLVMKGRRRAAFTLVNFFDVALLLVKSSTSVGALSLTFTTFGITKKLPLFKFPSFNSGLASMSACSVMLYCLLILYMVSLRSTLCNSLYFLSDFCLSDLGTTFTGVAFGATESEG